MSETRLVKSVLLRLSAYRILAWRQNTGAMKLDRRFVRFGAPGISDVLGVLPGGRFLAVEVKTPRGRVTAQQQMFLDTVNDAGGLGIVVRSVEELEQALANAGAIDVTGAVPC